MFVKQAANVLDLMEYFARRKRPATLAEISDDLGWPRSSTFNLVGTIADKGWPKAPALGEAVTLDDAQIAALVGWLNEKWV